jgi:transcriptional regulator with XRE-family HTH domain
MRIMEKVRRLLEERQLTQGWLCAVAKIDPSRMSKWMGGTGVPNAYQTLGIARALAVSMEYLADEEMVEPDGPALSFDERWILETARVMGLDVAKRRLLAEPGDGSGIRPVGPTYGDIRKDAKAAAEEMRGKRKA